MAVDRLRHRDVRVFSPFCSKFESWKRIKCLDVAVFRCDNPLAGTPVIAAIGTKDILRQPTGIPNENVAVSDINVNVARSRNASKSSDQIVLTGGALVADGLA